jgi:hypothetical protein
LTATRLVAAFTRMQVPAVPSTQVVDVTGCGNAFCGGFLAGLDAGLSLQDSGVWGCVAGSIMAEAQGVPTAHVESLIPTARMKQQQLFELMGAEAPDCTASLSFSSGSIGSSRKDSSVARSNAAACVLKYANRFNGPCSRLPVFMPQLPRHCKTVPRLLRAGGICRSYSSSSGIHHISQVNTGRILALRL